MEKGSGSDTSQTMPSKDLLLLSGSRVNNAPERPYIPVKGQNNPRGPEGCRDGTSPRNGYAHTSFRHWSPPAKSLV
jgi:hypothetical protein